MKKAKSNRGWIVDSLLAIGHLEATLSHLDESAFIDMDDSLAKCIYQARKDLMERLLKGSDSRYWCVLKHLSTAYVLSEESYHATHDDELCHVMTNIGDQLATVAEISLGLEKTECLRCLSERSGK